MVAEHVIHLIDKYIIFLSDQASLGSAIPSLISTTQREKDHMSDFHFSGFCLILIQQDK